MAPFPPDFSSRAYRESVQALVSSLDTDEREGLSEAAAGTRLTEHGRNELPVEPPEPAWRRFLAQFQDLLVLLLLAATAISAACGPSNATRRSPTRRSRSLPSSCSTPLWGTCRRRAP